MDPTRRQDVKGLTLDLPAGLDGSKLQPVKDDLKSSAPSSVPAERDALRKALMEQLPPMDPSQVVPFGHLLDRTAKIRYEALRNLVKDRLPETQLAERPKAIIAYAQESRMALLKLVALLRWKEQADVPKTIRTTKAGNGINATERQGDLQTAWHEGVKRTREHLAYTANEQLSALRKRNADVDTAIDVLVTGEYQRLPKMIDHKFLPQTLGTTVSASDALKRMNEIISFRLAVHESIPSNLQLLKIRDGKAYFRYLNLFEFALTVGPVDPHEQWCLADIKFLHLARQSVKGKEAQPTELAQQVKQRILEMADSVLYQIMLKKKDERSIETDTKAEMDSTGESETIPSVQRGTALYKLVNVLEMMAISNQFEILIAQATMMRRSEWQQHLQVDLSSDRRILRLRYWRRAAEQARDAVRGKLPVSTSESSYGGQISLSVNSEPTAARDISMQDADLTEDPEASRLIRRTKIQIEWQPESTWLRTDISHPASTSARQDIPEIDPSYLDLEAVVVDITKRHVALLTEELKLAIDEKIVHRDLWAATDVKYEVGETGPCVLMKAFSSRWLRLAVNHLTGELHLGEANAVVGSRLEARLAQASKIATYSAGKLVDNLLMTRSLFIRDSLEERLISMGRITSTRLDVNPQDSEKFGLILGHGGRQQKPVLLADLPTPDSYLLLVIDNKSVSYALMQLLSSAVSLGMRYRRIANFMWLNVADFGSAEDRDAHQSSHDIGERSTGFDVSPSLLSKLWVYCAARAKIQHLSDQLQSAGIRHDQGTNSRPSQVPALYVNTAQMVPQADLNLFYPILKVSCLWRQSPRIQLLFRLKASALPSDINPSNAADAPTEEVESLSYDAQNQVIAMRCDDFSVVQIAKLGAAVVTLQLASRIHTIQTSSNSFTPRLVSFDLHDVVIEFRNRIRIKLSYQPTMGGYSFAFEDHENLPAALWELDGVFETRFNQTMSSMTDGLSRFFQQMSMSLALILAVEDAKNDIPAEEHESLRVLSLSCSEYVICCEHNARRYGILARILDDLPKVVLSDVQPKLGSRIHLAAATIIRSFTPIKSAKLKALFEKSRTEAVADAQDNQQDMQARHALDETKADTGFLPLDGTTAMLVNGEWLDFFANRMVKNLMGLAQSGSL
ncbi:hypothetical protein QFC24_005655 [Naganishia onofrii]|uniref:Uncharacterized protein n=1 Tax=Naganishia onofrii TaxID=1851511 RepID=A0ACC2X673_9TREE|nr:hypothetical protein QFC24_005655 [Naganishia onofrii]